MQTTSRGGPTSAPLHLRPPPAPSWKTWTPGSQTRRPSLSAPPPSTGCEGSGRREVGEWARLRESQPSPFPGPTGSSERQRPAPSLAPSPGSAGWELQPPPPALPGPGEPSPQPALHTTPPTPAPGPGSLPGLPSSRIFSWTLRSSLQLPSWIRMLRSVDFSLFHSGVCVHHPGCEPVFLDAPSPVTPGRLVLTRASWCRRRARSSVPCRVLPPGVGVGAWVENLVARLFHARMQSLLQLSGSWRENLRPERVPMPPQGPPIPPPLPCTSKFQIPRLSFRGNLSIRRLTFYFLEGHVRPLPRSRKEKAEIE